MVPTNSKESIPALTNQGFTMKEFFYGKGKIAQAFRDTGFTTTEIDKRSRKGTCEPDIQCDILKVPGHLNLTGHSDVIYAGIPCPAFSWASNNYYFEGKFPKERAQPFIKLMEKTLQIIEESTHLFYFIENPQGKLRYMKQMIDFLSRTNGTIKNITLGSYGFHTIKPTDIFTNCYQWQPRQKLTVGRNAKKLTRDFDNLTKVQRAETPYALGLELAQVSYSILSQQKNIISNSRQLESSNF